MKIYGLFNVHNAWITYYTVNQNKYFYGAYQTKEKAKEIAEKIDGHYFYKN